MALTKKFADEFTHNAQHEGARIFRAGGVKFEDRLPDQIDFTVQGGRPYSVFLGRERDRALSVRLPLLRQHGRSVQARVGGA